MPGRQATSSHYHRQLLMLAAKGASCERCWCSSSPSGPQYLCDSLWCEPHAAARMPACRTLRHEVRHVMIRFRWQPLHSGMGSDRTHTARYVMVVEDTLGHL